MTRRLKGYETNQRQKAPAPTPLEPTGVRCPESKCRGEMGWLEPRKQHPELKELDRAHCLECGWRGWV